MATADGRVLLRRQGRTEEIVRGCGYFIGINGNASGYVVAVGLDRIVRIGTGGRIDVFKSPTPNGYMTHMWRQMVPRSSSEPSARF